MTEPRHSLLKGAYEEMQQCASAERTVQAEFHWHQFQKQLASNYVRAISPLSLKTAITQPATTSMLKFQHPYKTSVDFSSLSPNVWAIFPSTSMKTRTKAISSQSELYCWGGTFWLKNWSKEPASYLQFTWKIHVSFFCFCELVFSYTQFLCLSLRVIDLPIRSRRLVRESSRKSSACSTASACLSNPKVLSSWRRCNSERRPAAAAAVQVRSHDGWGLFWLDKERELKDL